MATFISILRGINVSGQNTIKMEALRQLCKELGLVNVQTYIQSGNIVYQSTLAEAVELSNLISQKIQEQFGFNVPVQTLNGRKLEAIIANNPFVGDPDKSDTFFHVTFLASSPQNSDVSKLMQRRIEGEELALIDDVVYLYCPQGYGQTKLSNNAIESHFKVSATTRNWKTVNILSQMAQSIGG